MSVCSGMRVREEHLGEGAGRRDTGDPRCECIVDSSDAERIWGISRAPCVLLQITDDSRKVPK